MENVNRYLCSFLFICRSKPFTQLVGEIDLEVECDSDLLKLGLGVLFPCLSQTDGGPDKIMTTGIITSAEVYTFPSCVCSPCSLCVE